MRLSLTAAHVTARDRAVDRGPSGWVGSSARNRTSLDDSKLLGMDDAQQADLRLALKDVANIVRSRTPAELIADEYRSLNPGAAIVAVRPDAPNRFGLIHNIASVNGVVIVVSATKDPELILRSMRAGAREFVLESDHEELRHAVRTHAKVQVGGSEVGQVVTIFGAKGGVGATAIAVNLAGENPARTGVVWSISILLATCCVPRIAGVFVRCARHMSPSLGSARFVVTNPLRDQRSRASSQVAEPNRSGRTSRVLGLRRNYTS